MARIDWNIHARAHQCACCAKDFEKGECVRSAVAPFESDVVKKVFAARLAEEAAAVAAGQPAKPHPDWARIDTCDACFETLEKKDVVSAWKSDYEPPVAANEDPLKKASPEKLLRELLEGDEPQNHLPVIYLLAVMLERKRILVERGVHDAPDGSRVHLYEHRKSGDILFITDPDLLPEAVPEVRKEIELLLGLREPEPEPPTAEELAAQAAAAQAEADKEAAEKAAREAAIAARRNAPPPPRGVWIDFFTSEQVGTPANDEPAPTSAVTPPQQDADSPPTE